MNKLSIAVLGAGRIGAIHAGNIAAHPRALLAAVADADAAAAARVAGHTGAQVRSVADILADAAIAAVAICTPTDTHAELVERAARAGKAVFCEKPVDLDTARIRACLGVVAAAKVPLMIGFNRRFDPSFAELARRLRAGAAGRVELVTILSRDPSPPPAAYAARSGGLYRDMMIHDLDMARMLLGEEPVRVYASGAALVDPDIGAAGDVDTAVCVLTCASGRMAQISNSRRATYGYDQRLEVHGSGGLIAAGNRTATTVVQAGADGLRTDPALPFFLERYADAYRLEIAAFIDAVLDRTPITPTGADGLAAAILADAATESSRAGRAVTVDLGNVTG